MTEAKKDEMVKVYVTPDMARDWLGTSIGNRSESNKKINAYAEMMKSGQWELSQDAIVFDVNGALRNGHHRLYALVLADVGAEFWVWRNAPENAWKVFDTGKSRGVDSMLEVEGKYKNARRMAAVGRMLLAVEKYREYHDSTECQLSVVVKKMQDREVFEYCNKNYDEMLESYEIACDNAGYRKCRTQLACLVCEARRAGQDSEVRDFVHKLMWLEGLDARSPILAVNRRIENMANGSEKDRCDILMLLYRAYEYFVEGVKVEKMQIPKDLPSLADFGK